MATTIPVPIEFSLPDGWQPAPPDEVGAAQAAFVALHPASSRGFTANITLAGDLRSVEATLATIAGEELDRLRSAVGDVQVGDTESVGTSENPGYTQAVRFTVDVKGEQRTIYQLQVFLGMSDVHNPGRRAVIQAVLTATEDQMPVVIKDFHAFIETVRPDTAITGLSTESTA